VRSVLPALPAKESTHEYELMQALKDTFGGAFPSPHIGRIRVTLARPSRAEWLDRCQEALT
jgi:DNA-binding PadR family transcriptional regulator